MGGNSAYFGCFERFWGRWRPAVLFGLHEDEVVAVDDLAAVVVAEGLLDAVGAHALDAGDFVGAVVGDADGDAAVRAGDGDGLAALEGALHVADAGGEEGGLALAEDFGGAFIDEDGAADA